MKKPQIIALILIAIATSFFVLNLDSGGSYGSFTQAKNKPDNEFTVAGELNQNKQIVYSPKVMVVLPKPKTNQIMNLP
jgi:hypothetical protein